MSGSERRLGIPGKGGTLARSRGDGAGDSDISPGKVTRVMAMTRLWGRPRAPEPAPTPAIIQPQTPFFLEPWGTESFIGTGADEPDVSANADMGVGEIKPKDEAGTKKGAKKKKKQKDEIVHLLDKLQGTLADLRDIVNAYEAGTGSELSMRIVGSTARAYVAALKNYELSNAQRLLVGQLEEDLNKQAERARDPIMAHEEENEEETEEEAPSDEGEAEEETGVPILDKGYTCEREDHENDEGCTLSSQERRDLTGTLQTRMLHALMNFQAAIQNARIKKLTASHAGWTFLAEFLFFSTTGVLIGGIVGALLKARAMEVEKLTEIGLSEKMINFVKSSSAENMVPKVRDLLINSSRGIRGALKAHFNSLSDTDKGHAAFLEVVQNAATMISAQTSEEAPTTLNDAELIRLTVSYDVAGGLHSVSSYAAIVNKMLAQYDDNGIGDIGDSKATEPNVVYQVAQLSVFNYRRTALIKFDAAESVGSGVVDESGKNKEVADEITNAPRRHFVRWVDDDFVELAEGVATERGSLLQLDVTVRDMINPDNDEYVQWRDQLREEYYATARAHDDTRNDKQDDNKRGDDDDREHSGGV